MTQKIIHTQYLSDDGKFDFEIVGLSEEQRIVLDKFLTLEGGNAASLSIDNFSSTALLPVVAQYWGKNPGHSSTITSITHLLYDAFEDRAAKGDLPRLDDPTAQNWMSVLGEISRYELTKEQSRQETTRKPHNVSWVPFINTNSCFNRPFTENFFFENIVARDPVLKQTFAASDKCQAWLAQHYENVRDLQEFSEHPAPHTSHLFPK